MIMMRGILNTWIEARADLGAVFVWSMHEQPRVEKRFGAVPLLFTVKFLEIFVKNIFSACESLVDSLGTFLYFLFRTSFFQSVLHGQVSFLTHFLLVRECIYRFSATPGRVRKKKITVIPFFVGAKSHILSVLLELQTFLVALKRS